MPFLRCIILAAAATITTALSASPQQNDRTPHKDSVGDELPPGAIARLGTTWFRAVGWDVAAVACSPDGKQLAQVSVLGVVSLWDIVSGSEIRRYGTFEYFLREGHVAFSPDGKLLAAAADRNETVTLWETATGKVIHRLAGHHDAAPIERRRNGVRGLAFAPDGKTLAVAGPDAVFIWDVNTGTRSSVAASVGPPLAFTPDSTSVAACTAGGAVRHWSIGSKRFTRDFPADAKRGRSAALAFAGARELLASCDNDNSLHVTDMVTGKSLHRLQPCNRWANVAFAPDLKSLIVVQNGILICWDLATGKEISRRGDSDHFVETATISVDGKLLVTGNSEGNTRVWQKSNGEPILVAVENATRITSLAFSPKGDRLVMAGEDSHSRLWDLKSAKVVGKFTSNATASRAVAYAPNGKHIAAAGPDGHIVLWDPSSGGVQLRFQELQNDVRDLAFSLDGNLLAAREPNGELRLMRVADGKPHALDRNLGSATVFAFSPDSRHLTMTGFSHATTALWDLETREKLRVSSLVLDPNSAKPTTLIAAKNQYAASTAFAISAQKNRLFIGSYWNPVSQFDVRTGAQLYAPQARQVGVHALAVSPDGRLLATVPRDGSDVQIQVWEIVSGFERRCFGGHGELITALAFSPDGKLLATGSNDTTALVWDVLGVRQVDAKAPTASEVEVLWQKLGGDQPTEAIASLIVHAKLALNMFKSKLEPLAREAANIPQFILDLDDNRFAVRQKAQQELEQLGEIARPALEKLISGNPTLEVRRRAELVLSRLPSINQPMRSPHILRQLRAVEVLEHIGSAEAKAVLQGLVTSVPGSLLAEEAEASLKRMK